MSIRKLVKQALTKRQNRIYERHLQARQMTYEQWCRKRETAGERLWTGELPAEQISAKESAGYVVCILGKGRPAENAGSLIEAYFSCHPQAQLLYGDEDVWADFPRGERQSPWFKPDWSPHLLDSRFYFGSLVAVRSELWKKALMAYGEAMEQEETVRRCVELAGGYEIGSKAVGHIPEILFHCESREAIVDRSTVKEAEAFCKAAGEAYGKKDRESSRTLFPQISVIIPSKDQPDILSVCLAALPKAMDGLPYEVIVVDNGSTEENRRRVSALLENHTYLYEPMEFHFSEMCNLGAAKAVGELLLFLNDDVELCTAGCVGQMAALAARPYTGAVGMKLYYPDSIRIQHAGITNLPMGPVHKLQFLEDNVSYYFDSNRGSRNVLAVTGACLMVEKKKFLQTGGFARELRVAFNDVDFCFRLWELGYFNVCRNDIYGYHHESLSRGGDEAAEKLNRLLEERKILYDRHPGLQGKDPYYSVHLSSEGLDTRIRPAYETAGNTPQKERSAMPETDTTDYRRDDCLLVRVESCVNGEIQGYGVVLGDNNACYEKQLLLESGEGIVFSRKLEGQHRPDLTENMPDQNRVGLCGFRIKIDEDNVPPGRYRIGLAARNRVTGLRLMQWSSRSLDISGMLSGKNR